MILYGIPDQTLYVPSLVGGCSSANWRDEWFVDPVYATPANAVWTDTDVGLIARAGEHFGVVGIDQRAADVLDTPQTQVHVEYDMLFDTSWGTISTADEGKVIGIYATAPGSDDADGGVPATGYNGFSVRTMFRAEANGRIPMCCYVYHVDQAGQYGDKFDWRMSSGGMMRERWYRVSLVVKINTVGVADGVIAVAVDGQPVLLRNNLRFRLDSDLLPGIERVRLQLYWGGSGTPTSDAIVRVRDMSVRWAA